MSEAAPMIDAKTLLLATVEGRLPALSVETGVSTPELARQALRLLEDPAVVAAHPIECRLLAERLEHARQTRSARRLTTRITV